MFDTVYLFAEILRTHFMVQFSGPRVRFGYMLALNLATPALILINFPQLIIDSIYGSSFVLGLRTRRKYSRPLCALQGTTLKAIF